MKSRKLSAAFARVRRSPWAVALVVLACLPAFVGSVWAAIPDGTGKITGCYSIDTGTLRVIDTDETPDCRAAERRLEWSQKGPKGDQGLQGIQGPKGDPGYFEVAYAGSTTDNTVNPMPTAATTVDSMSVQVGSDVPLIAVVTAFVSGTTDTSNSNRRFGIYLDGTLQFPFHAIGSQSQYNDDNIPANGWSWTASATIAIPGDAAGHTIDVRGQAKDDTNSTTYKNRSLGVVVGRL